MVALIVDGDETVGGGGFLAIRRLRLRNRRADGSASAGYVCDSIARPHGEDAVVVALYRRAADGAIEVLIRDGLRPALALARRDAYPRLLFGELVAGIVEPHDTDPRERAAAEALEEAGYEIAAAALVPLGAPSFPSPGSMVEQFHFFAADVSGLPQHPLSGDGSPMEEGARTRWLSLADAIAACESGALPDGKTELGLRRLRDHLARAAQR